MNPLLYQLIDLRFGNAASSACTAFKTSALAGDCSLQFPRVGAA